jgi:hypothetical protein
MHRSANAQAPFSNMVYMIRASGMSFFIEHLTRSEASYFIEGIWQNEYSRDANW